MDKLEALEKYFGYTSFRTGQETLIDALMSGHDALDLYITTILDEEMDANDPRLR